MAQPKIPKCHMCGASLSGARTIINGRWTCPTCTYKHDYPDKEVPESLKRESRRREPPQEETLFPLPTSIRRE